MCRTHILFSVVGITPGWIMSWNFNTRMATLKNIEYHKLLTNNMKSHSSIEVIRFINCFQSFKCDIWTPPKGCSHGYNTNDIFNYITKIFMRCILVKAGPTAGEWNHSFIITNQHQGIWNVKRCSLLLVNKLHIWWPSMQIASSNRA